jgi:catechol 2,3-dioxygenase-like lactoylglutathione lyase family enzyme
MSQDQQNRRPGVLAVHSVNHFLMDVPDLSEAANYFGLFGLDVRQEGGELGLYCFGSEHRWGIIRQGAPKKLAGLCFGCFEDDLPRFQQHLESAGIAFKSEGQSLHLADPLGLPLEIRVAPRSSNAAVAAFDEPGGGTGKRAAALRSDCPETQPGRMGHLAMFTGDLDDAIDFYQQALGLKLTDRSVDIVAFFHSPHGSDHHIVALLGGTGPGLHHLSWEVSSVNEVGVGATKMAMNGFAYGWGLGRHVLGSNYFHYVRDPWGSWTEYSAGMDYVPYDADWATDNYGPEDSFYLWGPDVPAGFTDNLEQGS